jgi:hypothetical protein
MFRYAAVIEEKMTNEVEAPPLTTYRPRSAWG